MTRLTRRTMLGSLGTAAVTSLGGCTGFLTGSEPLEFASDPVRVAESTVTQTDYELEAERAPTVSREVSLGGQTREVTVTNHVALYAKTVNLGPLGEHRAGLFTLLTTPEIEVAGRTFNPVAEFSNRDLIQRFGSQNEGLSVDDRVGTSTVRTLGAEVTVEKYAGTTTMKGREVDIYLHVARFDHDGDIVVAVGAYPQRLDGEGETIRTLVSNVEH